MHKRWPAGITRARPINTPAPLYPLFFGWDELDAHLESLEDLVPLIREIELEFLHG